MGDGLVSIGVILGQQDTAPTMAGVLDLSYRYKSSASQTPYNAMLSSFPHTGQNSPPFRGRTTATVNIRVENIVI